MPMRGISRFFIEKLLSHSTQNFVGEPFCVSQNFWYRKYLWIRGGGGGGGREYHDFLSKIFCLPMPKNFIGEPFCAVFQKISGSKKVLWMKGGVSSFSVENFLSHSAENFRMGTP